MQILKLGFLVIGFKIMTRRQRELVNLLKTGYWLIWSVINSKMALAQTIDGPADCRRFRISTVNNMVKIGILKRCKLTKHTYGYTLKKK